MLKIAFASNYCHPLPDGHRFPMKKYELLPEQLLYEGTIKEANIFTPGICSAENIVFAHHADYIQKLEDTSQIYDNIEAKKKVNLNKSHNDEDMKSLKARKKNSLLINVEKKPSCKGALNAVL